MRFLSLPCLVLLLGGLARPALAQRLPPVPDSLRAAYRAVPRPDAARLAVLLRVAYAYIEPLDSAGVLAYGRAAELLARRLADSVGVGQAVDVRGHYYQQVSNQTLAQPLLERAARLLAEAPAPVRGTNDYHLGWLYDELGQAPRALRHYRRAYALARQARDAGLQASVLNSWSSVYMYRQQYDSAQYFMLRSLRLSHRLGERAAEANSLGNLASILKMAGRHRAALPYARQAAGLQQALGDDIALAGTYNTLGDLSNALDSLGQARRYFRAALALGRRHRAEGDLSMTYIGLADVYAKAGALDSAERYHLAAIRAVERSRNLINLPGLLASLVRLLARQPARLPDAAAWAARLQALPTTEGQQPLLALEALAVVAEARHDYARALALHQRLDGLKAQALARNNEHLTQELRVRFDTDRAEQQVVVLQQARELERLRRQQQVGALLGVVAGLLALVGGVAGWYRRRQRRRETALRQRLAADLHDDLGPLLTQLAVESSLLRENTFAPAQLLARLQHLTDTSQQATRHLGAVLHDLDHGPAAAAPAPLGELVQHLREQAHELLAPHELGLTLHLADPALAQRPVSAVLRHALALIFREALHNVVKHAAGATLVRATLALEADGLLLTLLDDGQPLVLAGAAARPGGRGLRNMQARAEAVGGHLEARATAEGFRIRAWLPG